MGKPMTPKPMKAVLAMRSLLRPAGRSFRRDQYFVKCPPARRVGCQQQRARLDAGGRIDATPDIAVVAARFAMDQDAGAMVPRHQFREQGKIHRICGETQIFRSRAAAALERPHKVAPRLNLPAKFAIPESSGEQDTAELRRNARASRDLLTAAIDPSAAAPLRRRRSPLAWIMDPAGDDLIALDQRDHDREVTRS